MPNLKTLTEEQQYKFDKLMPENWSDKGVSRLELKNLLAQSMSIAACGALEAVELENYKEVLGDTEFEEYMKYNIWTKAKLDADTKAKEFMEGVE